MGLIIGLCVYLVLSLFGLIAAPLLLDLSFAGELFRMHPALGLAAGIAGGLVIVFICRLLSGQAWIKSMEEFFRGIVAEFKSRDIFLLALVSAVGEEIFFRFFLLNLFGLMLSSAVFAVLHFPIKKELFLWTLFAFIMGIILGCFYLYLGIVSAILVHFIVNFLNLHYLKSKSRTI
jgi:membrane protease YdiL (CAAX protease family)